MNEYFVVKNQHGQYINKQKEWVDGSEPKSLYRSKYKDEALNLVVELSAKDIHLRAMAFSCELDDKLQPVVDICTTMPITTSIVDGNESGDKDESGQVSAAETDNNAQDPKNAAIESCTDQSNERL